ncbi:MAG TPA: hypothetical protein VF549_07470 [Solirubrobacteraceae bacterium]|jgi:hypothetical protein
MSAADLQLEVRRLSAERLEAVEAGLGANAVYMAELDGDLVAAREAYVGLAVTEIATLRAELSGPQVG